MKKGKAKRQRGRNKKNSMANCLSICIVGKDKEEFLEECIDSCSKLGRSIAYLDVGSSDSSIDIAEQKGIRVAKDDPSLTLAVGLLEKTCNSDWILFLRPDEKPTLEPDTQLDRMLSHSTAEAYSLVVKKVVEPEILADYQWMKVNDQYRYAENKIYVPTVEIRLVRRQYFRKFLRLMVTWSKEDLFPLDSQILRELQINSCQYEKPKGDDPAKDKEREMKYLKGEISFDPEQEDGLRELGDGYLTFGVLTKKDLAGFYKGLSMGFGSEKMYLNMLRYLGQFGRFEDARDFFEAWKDKWGFFDTPEPYRIGGIIYTNLFELDKAVLCFEKYIKVAPEDRLAEPLSSLAKTYLLQGRKHKAIALLKRSLKLHHDKFDNILFDSITKDNWKPAKLSVCIIARNEESNIRRALESVSGIADEIVVVDTGSTDNTKEIVRKFNSNIIDTLWKDDFSRVRNLGLQEATGDYILCLDADEFVDSRERIHLALLKQILPAEQDVAFRIMIEPEEEDEEMAVMLRLQEFKQVVHPVRLFPACKEIRFEGTSFESVDNSLSSLGIKIKPNNLFKITHANSDRLVRDRRKEIAVRNAFDSISNPEIALKGVIYFLRLDELDTAVTWLEKTNIEDPRLLAKIIELYSNLGQAPKTAKIINKAMERFPESMELSLTNSEIMFIDCKYEEVCNILGHRMEAVKEALSREDVAKASYLYGMALLETGDLERGVEYLIEARDMDPWNTRYKMGGIYALTRGGEWEGAIRAVNDLLRDEDLDLGMTIDDFADFGIIFSRLSQHFLGKNRKDSADLCQRILEDIIENRLTKRTEIKKMTEFLNDLNEFREENINA